VCDVCPLDPLNDEDGDNICGDVDNCPNVYNPGQGPEDCVAGDIDGFEVTPLMAGTAIGGAFIVIALVAAGGAMRKSEDGLPLTIVGAGAGAGVGAKKAAPVAVVAEATPSPVVDDAVAPVSASAAAVSTVDAGVEGVVVGAGEADLPPPVVDEESFEVDVDVDIDVDIDSGDLPPPQED